MCIKAGKDELDSVKNLMIMSLKAVVASALDAEIEDVTPAARLVEDLKMGAEEREFLEDLVADTFDGLKVDLTRIATVGELLEVVVMKEFEGLLDEAPCEVAAESEERHYDRAA